MFKLDEVSPHLALLDLHLPNVSGVEILKRICTDARLQNIYVIVASTDAGLSMMEEVNDSRPWC